MYGKDRLGYDRFGQFMSGHVTMEYSLPKNFGSENFWDPIKNLGPKVFGLGMILESTFFGPKFSCLLISWHQNLA